MAAADGPRALRIVGRSREDPSVAVRLFFFIAAFTVIEDQAEHPLRGLDLMPLEVGLPQVRLGRIEQERNTIAVADPLQIPVRGPLAMTFIGQIEVDAFTVFFGIVIDDRVALIVETPADQPTKYMLWVPRIGDLRIGIEAIDRQNVVLGDRAPMGCAIVETGPALDTGEQSLCARAIGFDRIPFAWRNRLVNPASIFVADEHWNQILRSRQNENVRLFVICVTRQAFIGSPRNRG